MIIISRFVINLQWNETRNQIKIFALPSLALGHKIVGLYISASSLRTI